MSGTALIFLFVKIHFPLDLLQWSVFHIFFQLLS